MRMRELEKKTGVGRETIRYYIREGLLPEPERPTPNSASYCEEHVTRLRVIKRLQEERFLPLAIIRTLLDAEDGERWLHAEAFPDLDAMLRARLDTGGAGVPLAEVAEQTGCTMEEMREAAASGTLVIGEGDMLAPRDVAIAKCLAELRDIGFTRERGFSDGSIAFYADFVKWLVAQEMRQFFDHTAGQVDETEALAMAERGVSTINEMLSLMRTREILHQLQARRRIANDNT
jgi:DNA-binding transcriptional MerR regulator